MQQIEKSVYLPYEVATELEARAADHEETFSAYLRKVIYTAEGFEENQ